MGGVLSRAIIAFTIARTCGVLRVFLRSARKENERRGIYHYVGSPGTALKLSDAIVCAHRRRICCIEYGSQQYLLQFIIVRFLPLPRYHGLISRLVNSP